MVNANRLYINADGKLPVVDSTLQYYFLLTAVLIGLLKSPKMQKPK